MQRIDSIALGESQAIKSRGLTEALFAPATPAGDYCPPDRGRWRSATRTLRLGWVGFVLICGLSFGLEAEESSVEPDVERRFEQAYLSVVVAWAEGTPDAVAQLADLEHRFFSDQVGFEITVDTYPRLPYGSAGRSFRYAINLPKRPAILNRRLRGSNCLREIQKTTYRWLLDFEPEALLALSQLHHLTYEEHMSKVFRPWLAEPNKDQVFATLDGYRRHAPSSEALSNTVAMLVSLADTLQNLTLFETGVETREVYLRVLDLAPDHFAARYWAAFLEERSGNYRRAAKHLSLLAGARPEDPEIVLRWAINRQRIGATDAHELEAIARRQQPDWLRIIAYQEAGRLLAETDLGRALVILREGSEHFPDNVRLRLQLSNLLHEDWQVSSTLVQEVESEWGGDSGLTPRSKYCDPRRDELDQERRRLERVVEQRKTALATALIRLLEENPGNLLTLSECPENPAW